MVTKSLGLGALNGNVLVHATKAQGRKWSAVFTAEKSQRALVVGLLLPRNICQLATIIRSAGHHWKETNGPESYKKLISESMATCGLTDQCRTLQ